MRDQSHAPFATDISILLPLSSLSISQKMFDAILKKLSGFWSALMHTVLVKRNCVAECQTTEKKKKKKSTRRVRYQFIQLEGLFQYQKITQTRIKAMSTF